MKLPGNAPRWRFFWLYSRSAKGGTMPFRYKERAGEPGA
jgi:hypothetical protein